MRHQASPHPPLPVHRLHAKAQAQRLHFIPARIPALASSPCRVERHSQCQRQPPSIAFISDDIAGCSPHLERPRHRLHSPTAPFPSGPVPRRCQQRLRTSIMLSAVIFCSRPSRMSVSSLSTAAHLHQVECRHLLQPTEPYERVQTVYGCAPLSG
jgi:hypothetical protein